MQKNSSIESTKLYQVLSLLNKDQHKAFQKYLKSPYFNTNKDLEQLYLILQKSINRVKPISKADIWALLRADAVYDDVRFRKFNSDLFRLLKNFLSQQIYDSNDINQSANLMEAIIENKIENLYSSFDKIDLRSVKNRKQRDSGYYYNRFRMAKMRNDLQELQGRKKKLQLEEVDVLLDKFFISEKLLNYHTALSHSKLVEHDYNILFIEEILEHLSKQPYESPQIDLYYLMTKLYLDDDDATYNSLKQAIFQSNHELPESNAREVFHAALNYCLRNANAGKPGFVGELFELYKHAIEMPFFYSNDKLTPWSFKNIVLVSLRLKEFDWCEKFIQEYSQRLPLDERDNAVLFNTARLTWYRKEYGHVLELLSKVEFDDITYNLPSKTMIMSCYYELEQIELLLSFIESFRIFLQRNTAKIPSKRRKNYLKLISYTAKLARLNFMEKDRVEKLKIQIESDKELGDKSWLLDKLAEGR